MVALTASVIPAVSAARHAARPPAVRPHRALVPARHALLAFPMGLGLWALSDPLFRLFYRSYNAELGGSLLAVLGIASIFVCLMLITNSILQAYGRVSVPIVTMLIGGGVKIVLNYNLVALPSVNIHGAPIGTLVCFALTALLNLIAVARIAPFRLNYPGYFLRPLFASLVMAFAAEASTPSPAPLPYSVRRGGQPSHAALVRGPCHRRRCGDLRCARARPALHPPQRPRAAAQGR